jgi:hypothetical protein
LDGTSLVLARSGARERSPGPLTAVNHEARLTKLSRPEHQSRHIEAALEYAEERGWRVEKSGPRAHAWGRLYCGAGHTLHQKSVWGTPRNPENHAKSIRRFVDQCNVEEEV